MPLRIFTFSIELKPIWFSIGISILKIFWYTATSKLVINFVEYSTFVLYSSLNLAATNGWLLLEPRFFLP